MATAPSTIFDLDEVLNTKVKVDELHKLLFAVSSIDEIYEAMHEAERQSDARADCERRPRMMTRMRFVSIRIWQRVRDRGSCGSAADRPECAADASARALYRAVQRHAIYRAAGRESAHLDLPHSALGDAPALRRSRRWAWCAAGRLTETPTTPNQLALGSAAPAGEGDGFS